MAVNIFLLSQPCLVLSEHASFTHTLDGNFVDNAGRTLLLRGVNLSGSCKAPVNRRSQVLDGFWEEAKTGCENFVGRPLKLDDADEHLARLGKYDYEFMDDTIEILRKCKAHGCKVYMNPHQDTVSFFAKALLLFSNSPFSAIIHCEYPTPASRNPAKLPAMIWSTNYGRLVSHTMFALFFGDSTFAPKCILDRVHIQEYLRPHFANAFGKLVERVAAAGDPLDEVVIGWDSMNEPAEGLIPWNDLNAYPVAQGSTFKKGTVPSPAQSFRLGMGQMQTLDNYTFGSDVTIDSNGVKAWSDPSTEPGGIHPRWGWRRDPGWTFGTCVRALHDVWDVQSGYVTQPDYFARVPGTEAPVHFLRAFFLSQCALHLKAPPMFQGRACYSTHYYDGLTPFNADALGLLRGKYSTQIQALCIGERAIWDSLQSQLGYLKADATQLEIGTPINMDVKRSYGYTDGGKYKTVWTCCPDSSHPWGNGWNMEDLSLWCNDLRAGEVGRVPGIQTPFKSSMASTLSTSTLPIYPSPYANSSVEDGEPVKCDPASLLSFLTNCATCPVVGTPTNIQFDISKATFRLTLKVHAEDIPINEDDDIVPGKKELYKDSSLPTEIFLPFVHFALDACLSKALGSAAQDQVDDFLDVGQEWISHSSSGTTTPRAYTSSTLTLPLTSQAALSLIIFKDDLYDIAVTASEGRLELLASEQRLLWFYTVLTEKEDKELTIEVRRSSGAIKANALGLGYTT
ncbi:glycoside hydrolase family 5 protein [Suillus paluster]|uniref:glycoside hydrolase family 5 protein n=1 Tax=Suillus paluster TaxID=48578 RepID=UPI001B865BCD|nr:glycoside hydrolase family 5 protein [Suillus paluster]KAG1723668.1 glycoside hydrolase family 5 protein [Suillus paluster]